MKKLLFLLALLLLPLASNAEAVEVNGIYYELVTDKGVCYAEVTNHPNNYAGDIVIPEHITYDNIEYTVSSIGNSAFNGCSNLSSVSIPNSVTYIGPAAFASCTSLEKFIIPNNVKKIDNFAFEYSGITSIEIPNSVDSLGLYVFFNCIKLESLVVGSGLKNIDGFSGCEKLSSITFSEGVETIGDYAFSGCKSLKKVIVPNSVQSICTSAFDYCTSLMTVYIGDGVNSIGEMAFAFCKDLKDIYISSEKGASAPWSNTFDNSYIQYATLHVPENLIPKYKENDVWNSFEKIIDWDGSINYESDPSVVYGFPVEINGLWYTLISKLHQAEIVGEPSGQLYTGDIVIPDHITYDNIEYTVTRIGTYAFAQCMGLTSVSIPNSVTIICSGAFYGCINLEKIDIPNSVKEIGREAFFLAGLKSITIPNSVESLGNSVFLCCSRLKKVIIGSNVTSIGTSAFDECDLTEVISEIETPFAINIKTFSDNAYNNALLSVPKGTLDKYKTTEGWNQFFNIAESETSNINKFESKGIYEQMRYSINGSVVNKPSKGINIIKMKDGTTKKIIVK